MIWKIAEQFFLLMGVWGHGPRRGGSGKAAGFEAWGRLPPVFLLVILKKNKNEL
jgi:hypothetical protein